LAYDPALVEEVVHLYARSDGRRWREYRRRIDPLYEREDRAEAITEAAQTLFRDWELGRPCDEAGTLACGAAQLLVGRCLRPGDEGADLLVGEERTVLLRLSAERFLDPDFLRIYVRHEMRHIADMLDPSFGYEPDLGIRGRTRAETELVRMRYRVLWDLAIDRVETSPMPAEARRAQFESAFVAMDEEQCTRLAEYFAEPARRTHGNLTAAARDPWSFLGVARSRAPQAGQPCPLCGFPTYDWEGDPPREPILADFPAWEPSHGACRQCADIYRAAAVASSAQDGQT
jgi:hypothetical protein